MWYFHYVRFFKRMEIRYYLCVLFIIIVSLACFSFSSSEQTYQKYKTEAQMGATILFNSVNQPMPTENRQGEPMTEKDISLVKELKNGDLIHGKSFDAFFHKNYREYATYLFDAMQDTFRMIREGKLSRLPFSDVVDHYIPINKTTFINKIYIERWINYLKNVDTMNNVTANFVSKQDFIGMFLEHLGYFSPITYLWAIIFLVVAFFAYTLLEYKDIKTIGYTVPKKNYKIFINQILSRLSIIIGLQFVSFVLMFLLLGIFNEVGYIQLDLYLNESTKISFLELLGQVVIIVVLLDIHLLLCAALLNSLFNVKLWTFLCLAFYILLEPISHILNIIIYPIGVSHYFDILPAITSYKNVIYRQMSFSFMDGIQVIVSYNFILICLMIIAFKIQSYYKEKKYGQYFLV
ncbi:hypothetical protein KG091_00190 [Carnobacteriaceae bacterium zg-ZUI78]|nr:hypothetical protein [Carnobacteriaceae bacterium zg-ZUI78]